MTEAIQILLTLIQGLLPSLGVASTSVVDQILAALIQIVPIISANAANFLQPVQNIIAALQSSGALTADQLAALAALDAQVDAAFDAAVAADPSLKAIATPPATPAA